MPIELIFLLWYISGSAFFLVTQNRGCQGDEWIPVCVHDAISMGSGEMRTQALEDFVFKVNSLELCFISVVKSFKSKISAFNFLIAFSHSLGYDASIHSEVFSHEFWVRCLQIMAYKEECILNSWWKCSQVMGIAGVVFCFAECRHGDWWRWTCSFCEVVSLLNSDSRCNWWHPCTLLMSRIFKGNILVTSPSTNHEFWLFFLRFPNYSPPR